MDEWQALQKEEALAKRFKKGKISEKKFGEEMAKIRKAEASDDEDGNLPAWAKMDSDFGSDSDASWAGGSDDSDDDGSDSDDGGDSDDGEDAGDSDSDGGPPTKKRKVDSEPKQSNLKFMTKKRKVNTYS